MIKTYHIFKRLFTIILTGISLTTVMSIIAFSLAFDDEAKTLDTGSPLSLVLFIMTAFMILMIARLAFKTRKLHFERIKKHTRLTSFCGFFAAVMALGAVINDVVEIVVNKADYTVIAYVHMALTALACVYFVIEALPRFINRKWVVIPMFIRRTLSLGVIAWAIIGVFVIYFDGSGDVLSSSIIYNGKILAYVAMALFFVFEAEREFAKPKYGMLIFSALTTALIAFVLSGGLIFCLVFGTLELDQLGFNILDHFFTASIGLFCISRVYSILKTLRLIIINSDN